MAGDLFVFEWPVAAGGYRIVERPVATDWIHEPSPDAYGPVSIVVADDPNTHHARWYRPLEEHPALFREFADLADAPGPLHDRILRFANSYGRLSGATEVYYPYGLDTADLVDAWEHVRSGWSTELVLIREAVNLWELIRSNEEDELRRRITTFDNGSARYDTPSWHGSIVNERDHPLRKAVLGEVYQLAWLQLQIFFGFNLIGVPGAAPALRTNMVWDSGIGRLQFRQTPDSLLTAMWLQLGLAIDHDKRYHQCEEQTCRRWFEVRPDLNRADKLYCSDACRMRAYRRRRRERDGLPVDGGIAEV